MTSRGWFTGIALVWDLEKGFGFKPTNVQVKALLAL
jgi:hypothetical protein